MPVQQIVQYNGEYYLVDAPTVQTNQFPSRGNIGMWGPSPQTNHYTDVNGIYGAVKYFDNPARQNSVMTSRFQSIIDKAIASGQMTPFSDVLGVNRQAPAPIQPTPFAGWGDMGGGNSQPLPVPAAPTFKNPQSAPAPTAPQGQPNTNAGGTNWNLQKINAFQNTGR